VSQSGHQNEAFAVRQSGRCEATDHAIEEILVLIKMDDVIVRRGVR
jgi:hypothetical protein